MKHKYLLKSLILGAFLFVGTETMAQSMTTINPSKDNTIYSHDNTKSNGSGEGLYIGRTKAFGNRRGLLEFDIASTIPAGSTIDSVTLTLTVTASPNSTSYTFNIYEATKEWGEGSSNAGPVGGSGTSAATGDATWQYAEYTSSSWSSSGGDYNSTSRASASASGTTSKLVLTSTAMKNDVQGWLNNSSNNHGWIIIGDESTSQSAREFASREASSDKPVLKIWYSSCSKAAFTSSGNCINNPVNFNNTSTNAISYRWDFNNDGVYDDTTANPSYTFTTSGNKPVKLVSITSGGCRDSVTKTVLVFPSPNVSFTHDTGCVGSLTNFTSTLAGAKYEWDWNNDNTFDSTVTTQDISYALPSSGMINITLRMTDFSGCIGMKTQQVYVATKPNASFTSDKVCGKLPTTFKNNSSAATAINTYKWDFDNDGIFDDSTTTTADVTYSYPSGGTKQAKLLLITEYNCIDSSIANVDVDSIPLISLNISTVCFGVNTTITDNSTVPASSNYKWDFNNDGVYDDFTSGNKSLAFNIGKNPFKIVIDAPNGCIDSLVDTATVEQGIVAAVTTDTACLGNTTNFTDNSTVTSTANYFWDFDNDGNVDDNTKGSTTTTYTLGTHTAKLNIVDADGCKDSIIIDIEVKPLPTVSFTADNVCFGTATAFTDNSTTGSNSSYSWDFDNDGNVDDDTVGNTTFNYPTGGNHNAKLLITDEFGCLDSSVLLVNVKQKPGTNFTIAQDDPDVTLTNTTGGTVTSFEWDFGNDTTNVSNDSLTYTYFKSGTYTICLTTTNECGDSTVCQTISIIGASVSHIKMFDLFSIGPNPFSHNINIISKSGYEYNFTVTDIQGQKLYSFNNLTGNYELALTELDKGIYFIHIDNELGSITYKILKAK